MTSDPLSPLDVWILARAVAGYDLSSPVAGLSRRALALLQRLVPLHVRDRDRVLRGMITPSEHRAVLAVDTEQPAPKPPPVPERPYRFLMATQLDNLPPMAWIVPGEIPEQGLSVIFGEAGVGKSFLTIDYALRIAQSDRVIYIPTEGEAGYKKRVAAWCRYHRRGPGQLAFLFGAVILHDPKVYAELLGDLRKFKPRLVIVDTLAMAMTGLDENSARDMGVIMRACRHLIREIQTSVLLVHHTGKSGAAIRGSSALPGNADTMIRVTNADDLLLVECAKTKDEEPFPARYLRLLPVRLEDGTESRVPVLASSAPGSSGRMTPNQARLLDILALESNRDGVSLRDLAEQTGLSLTGVHRAASNMLRKGWLHKPHGSYAATEIGLLALEAEQERNSHGERSGGVPPDLSDVPGVPGDVADRLETEGWNTSGTAEHDGTPPEHPGTGAEQRKLDLGGEDAPVRRRENYYRNGA